MKLYELTYLASPDLSKEELKELSQDINSFIAQENGTLDQEIEPVGKRLSYPIKRKTEAFLVTFNFRLDTKNLEKLEKKLKEKNQILRYIILIRRLIKKTVKRVPRKSLEKTLSEEEIFKTNIKSSETQKVELKEIDKKIEEILNE